MGERGRVAEAVLPGGVEPDPRFTLANERTFLAWIRTALAFIAGGLALEAFAADSFAAPLRQALVLLVILLGILIAIGAAARWRRVELSMRHGRALPIPSIVPLLSLGVAAAAIVTLAVVLAS
ncbi:DUF202 domain-containing protein [Salinibacterium sp. dk2585]|uniref:YidH family protein n=1 Tax=unclassified Salinibacterium TaxID=2632331 RepID=UPI0011C2581F|nr:MULTISPECIES: DUF202 domain-containing protein [unclassified Salinibacterium]QEE61426.1 DUF202 domain-containing protein [Salinibacterium sp. dk2585]TXK54103.1 DUF202 domain-containing protein [Salinibacterium sp. dk5596]